MEKKIVVNDENIIDVVKSEIERLGNDADLNHIDVSGVTDMWGLFEKSKFNGDISKWDVGNVWDMSWMFAGSQFNQDISNWDVSNVVNMDAMFKNSKFNQDISNWDVGNVENMHRMFEDSIFDKNIDMWNYNFKAVEERSEEHTSELQSRPHLVCRLLLEKKNQAHKNTSTHPVPTNTNKMPTPPQPRDKLYDQIEKHKQRSTDATAALPYLVNLVFTVYLI